MVNVENQNPPLIGAKVTVKQRFLLKIHQNMPRLGNRQIPVEELF